MLGGSWFPGVKIGGWGPFGNCRPFSRRWGHERWPYKRGCHRTRFSPRKTGPSGPWSRPYHSHSWASDWTGRFVKSRFDRLSRWRATAVTIGPGSAVLRHPGRCRHPGSNGEEEESVYLTLVCCQTFEMLVRCLSARPTWSPAYWRQCVMRSSDSRKTSWQLRRKWNVAGNGMRG